MKWVLEAANKRWSNLPKLAKYVEGNSNRLCYTWMFGHCPWGTKCEFQHPPARKFDDEFVNKCHDGLKPGLAYIYKTKPAEPGG